MCCQATGDIWANMEVVELQRRRAEGVLIKELMKEYDLSKASVYRYLRQDENQTEASVNGGD